MRKVLAVLAAVVVLALAGGYWIPALAADAAAQPEAGFAWGKALSSALPLVVPLLIFGLKAAWDKIPKVWLPILAPILGAVADVLLQYAGASTWGPQWGAVLGAAGVGLREIYDQVTGNAKKPPG